MIALSSSCEKFKEVDIFETYVAKPIHETQLLEIIFEIFTKSGNKINKIQSGKFSGIANSKSSPILVAEDIYLNQKVILGMLSRLGYEDVTTAVTGREVLEKIKKKNFSLILMDIKMPEMDGITAAKKLRKRYGKNCPTIIALTAIAMKGEKEKAIHQKIVDGYLVKPIDIETLHGELSKFI